MLPSCLHRPGRICRSAAVLACLAAAVLALAVLFPAAAQPLPDGLVSAVGYLHHFPKQELAHIVRVLASDLFAGRGVGTRGEQLSAIFLENQLSNLGLVPLKNLQSVPPTAMQQSHPYAHDVRLHALSVESATMELIGPDNLGDTVTLAHGQQIVLAPAAITPAQAAAYTGLQAQAADAQPPANRPGATDDADPTSITLDIAALELVFVGFGIIAPEYGWDDYAGTDVSGKIAVVLVNDPGFDPGAREHEADGFFMGRTLTYYGRWTYKFEEAQRHGAAGVLLVHTDELAGYGFHVPMNMYTSPMLSTVSEDADAKPQLRFAGWIRAGPAAALLARLPKPPAGLSADADTTAQMDAWIHLAASREFTAQPIPVRARVRARAAMRTVHATNVMGVLPGRERPDEFVLLSAHHDHLGTIPSTAGGDDVYNGAVDNAAGVAAVMHVLRALLQLPREQRPARSILVAFWTAEEAGLLGAHAFVQQAGSLNRRIAAVLNYDVMNVWGKTQDVVAIGAEFCPQINSWCADAAAGAGLELGPDPSPNQGHFFRSDQFALARAGICGVNPMTGTQFTGQPEGYYDQVITNGYNAHDYHQPSDEYHESWLWGGFYQQTEFGLRFLWAAANSDAWPTFDESHKIPA